MHIPQCQLCLPADQLTHALPCLQNYRNADGSRAMPPGGHKQLIGAKLRVRVTQVCWLECWC